MNKSVQKYRIEHFRKKKYVQNPSKVFIIHSYKE